MASELPPPRRRRTLPVSPSSIGLASLAALVTVFAVLNLRSVKVDWIVGSSHAPLIVVIAVSLLLGVAGGGLGQHMSGRRKR